MKYQVKNYTEPGGKTTVIGGTLIVKAGATLDIKDGATVTGLGAVAQADSAAHQADSAATTVAGLKDDLNALLAKLRAAGLMVAQAEATE